MNEYFWELPATSKFFPTALMQNHLNALTSLTSDVFDVADVVVVAAVDVGPE